MDAIPQDVIPPEPLLQPGQLVFVHCTTLPARLGMVDVPLRPLCHYRAPGGLA